MTENFASDCLARIAAGQPVTDTAQEVSRYLASDDFRPGGVIATDGGAIVLDLAVGSQLCNKSLKGLPVDELAALIDRSMRDAGTAFAFGRYAEPRDLYHTDIFASGNAPGAERRDLHMGIDLFCTAGTSVHSPLDGVIEVASNNTAELDYGPMLIVRHETDNRTPFYILYGHLGLSSIEHLRSGDRIGAGEKLAEIGAAPENGNWPPHLHFQLIIDLIDLGADFPGVAYRSQQDMWLALSPSPAVFFPECEPGPLDARNAALPA